MNLNGPGHTWLSMLGKAGCKDLAVNGCPGLDIAGHDMDMGLGLDVGGEEWLEWLTIQLDHGWG